MSRGYIYDRVSFRLPSDDFGPSSKRTRGSCYRPFGFSFAPAAWSEVVAALAHLMANICVAIITHYIDDILKSEI